MVELSVVIPVYGCRDCLRTLHRRLGETLAPITSSYELIFVDDRSPDDAWDELRDLAADDPTVRALRLSRNFGQHAAITAGLEESSGRFTVVMDCDLQDPPEHIARLYGKAQEGYDVVYSRRLRRRQSPLRRVAGALYFRVRNRLVRSDMDPNMTNLSILSRKVVDAFLRMGDRNRQYLLIVDWLGFRHTTLDVQQDPRYSGRSAYSVSALVRVAIDGLFFDSTSLLRWVVYTGFAVACAGGLLAAVLLGFLIARDPLPDWISLGVIMLVLGGFVILTTGVTGIYIGKIFEQVKNRPLFVVDTRMEGGVERSFSRELAAGRVSVPDEPEGEGAARRAARAAPD